MHVSTQFPHKLHRKSKQYEYVEGIFNLTKKRDLVTCFGLYIDSNCKGSYLLKKFAFATLEGHAGLCRIQKREMGKMEKKRRQFNVVVAQRIITEIPRVAENNYFSRQILQKYLTLMTARDHSSFLHLVCRRKHNISQREREKER